MTDVEHQRDLIMIGTDLDAKGGIATVVRKYREFGLFEKWRITYLCTHVEGPVYRKLKVAVLAYGKFIHLLIQRKVGLVHIHLASRASTWRKLIFAFTAFFFRVPYVLHLHGGGFDEFFHEECGPVRRKLIRSLLTSASIVIVLSKSWAQNLREMAPGSHLEVIYNSVSLPAGEKKNRHCELTGKILFLGKITRRKGVFDLIRACALLPGEWKLLLGGDGDVDAARELIAQLSLSNRVQLLGWIAGGYKDDVLSTAAVFVLPSYYEGLPMSILEAMAWGIPVITTRVGGIPELVRQGQDGLFVQPGDIAGLAAALQALLDDPTLRQNFGANGKRRVGDVFSDAVVFPQLEAVWTRSGLTPSSMSKISDCDVPLNQ